MIQNDVDPNPSYLLDTGTKSHASPWMQNLMEVFNLWSFIMSEVLRRPKALGSPVHQTTSYHTWCKSMVKCFHRSFKSALRACLPVFNRIDLSLPSSLLPPLS